PLLVSLWCRCSFCIVLVSCVQTTVHSTPQLTALISSLNNVMVTTKSHCRGCCVHVLRVGLGELRAVLQKGLAGWVCKQQYDQTENEHEITKREREREKTTALTGSSVW